MSVSPVCPHTLSHLHSHAHLHLSCFQVFVVLIASFIFIKSSSFPYFSSLFLSSFFLIPLHPYSYSSFFSFRSFFLSFIFRIFIIFIFYLHLLLFTFLPFLIFLLPPSLIFLPLHVFCSIFTSCSFLSIFHFHSFSS